MKHGRARLFQTLVGLVIALISFIAPAWAAAPAQKVLYAFQGGSDGSAPESGLIFDASGNLYGTTTSGGGSAQCINGCGTVFELMQTSNGWSETVLYSFQGGEDGYYPDTGLAMDGAGNLYGTTLDGGSGYCLSFGCGTVFELSPPANGGPWTKSTIYSFQDGAFYPTGVILDKFGNLYGATIQGGNQCGSEYGCGTVFELSLLSGSWTAKFLYSFQGEDGATPEAGLTMDDRGNLYGTTLFGGISNLGTVYELYLSNGTWSEKVLWSFTPTCAFGCGPGNTLVFDRKGDLFGTALGGTPNGCCGVVFALQPGSGGSWAENVFPFTLENGGASPGTLLLDTKGNLYGTNEGAGQFGEGTAYRLRQEPQGHVTISQYSFCSQPGCPDGSWPFGGLILDGSGNFYGTASQGGLGYGVVYEITP